jgi:hypothetical protein
MSLRFLSLLVALPLLAANPEPMRLTLDKQGVHPSQRPSHHAAGRPAVFQAYPNIIGIMGGETLLAHYHGGANQVFMNRLLKLCAKYGRIFYDADGTYPDENKWEALYGKEGALMRDYAGYLVFAQKNNILHRQFVSQSTVLGLYLSGASRRRQGQHLGCNRGGSEPAIVTREWRGGD